MNPLIPVVFGVSLLAGVGIFCLIITPAFRAFRITKQMARNRDYFNKNPREYPIIRADGPAMIWGDKQDLEDHFIEVRITLPPQHLRSWAAEEITFPMGTPGGRVSSLVHSVADRAVREYIMAIGEWDLIAPTMLVTGEEVIVRLSKQRYFPVSKFWSFKKKCEMMMVDAVLEDGSVQVGTGL